MPELQGKIVQLLQLETGEGKNGTWIKKGVIIEHGDKYPKKVRFDCWGEVANSLDGLTIGNDIKVHYNDPESREFNGKWYTDLKVWKIETRAFNAPQAQQPTKQTAPVAELSSFNADEQDLPF